MHFNLLGTYEALTKVSKQFFKINFAFIHIVQTVGPNGFRWFSIHLRYIVNNLLHLYLTSKITHH